MELRIGTRYRRVDRRRPPPCRQSRWGGEGQERQARAHRAGHARRPFWRTAPPLRRQASRGTAPILPGGIPWRPLPAWPREEKQWLLATWPSEEMAVWATVAARRCPLR